MKKILLIIILIIAASFLCNCGGGGEKSPNPPAPVDGVVVTQLNIQAPATAIYSDGSAPIVQGFRIWISRSAGYSTKDLLTFDVGYAQTIPLKDIIPGDGTWYVSVSEYDALGESGRQGEIAIKAKSGIFLFFAV